MGRRSRQRQREGERPRAPERAYEHPDHGVLVLRAVLAPGSRLAYREALAGSPLSREDAWQRGVELLFERLAVRWEIAGVATERQRELLGRLRLASPEERRWVRDTLRAHIAEYFPDVEAP